MWELEFPYLLERVLWFVSSPNPNHLLASSFYLLLGLYPIPSPEKIFLESHQNSVQMWAAVQARCVGDILRLFWFITSVRTFLEFFIFPFFDFHLQVTSSEKVQEK